MDRQLVERLRGLGLRGLGLPDVPSRVALNLPDGIPFEAWASVGEALCTVEASIQWWIGDWWAYGERRYGKRKEISDLLREQGRKIPGFQALMNFGWVAKRFEPSTRVEAVSWSVHRALAAVDDPVERGDLLSEAEIKGWTERKAKAEVSQRKVARDIGCGLANDDTCTVADLRQLVAGGTRYGCIYADPPWPYDNQGTRGATGKHYAGLTVEQLTALPVRGLAANDAHLHLWTTNGFLKESIGLMEAWGFELRSTFVWIKPTIGTGNYWRNSHELMLTGIRGNATRFRDRSLKSWVECKRGQHSAKPEQVRHFIERASPGPYLELFGRSPATGWTTWGDQISRGLLHHDVREVA
jgi:N6-adenosine-specific RNA methylase IME4